MSDLSNILREESLEEQFYQELKEGNIDAAETTMQFLKDMHVPTWRHQKAIDEAVQKDDVTFEPYEHEIPVMSPQEAVSWDESGIELGESKGWSNTKAERYGY